MPSLSILIPFYDDLQEAIELAQLTRSQVKTAEQIQSILIGLDPSRQADLSVGLPRAANIEVIFCDSYQGFPKAKDAGLRASSGEMVFFLYPGIEPQPGAIDHLLTQLQAHPDWGAVTGCWRNGRGLVEKGYNVRRFPTFRALLWDVLFINKLFPRNRTTRHYKMHDFDYSSVCQADHSNDSVFMARRRLLIDLGGFGEFYRFGWFDQVEVCRKLNQDGHPVYFDPGAMFVSTNRPTLVNRLLADHYSDFYSDQERYVRREFGFWRAKIFRVSLAVGMVLRLTFVRVFPLQLRSWLLKRFHSYVGDQYLQGMSQSYVSLLRTLIQAGPTKERTD
ncbi:MAG: hypothetical protein LAO21_05280 [Acidobacteriia bacterium]|nr:hypothetical protein [Terriglobia bacterium]